MPRPSSSSRQSTAFRCATVPTGRGHVDGVCPDEVVRLRMTPVDPYRFESFQEFLYIFAAVSRSLRDPDDYARLAREFVEDALAQNVIYGELFVSPPVWTFFNPELDVRATLRSDRGRTARGAAARRRSSSLPDLTRNFGADCAMETARAVAAMTDLDVVGVSLGGDEARFPGEALRRRVRVRARARSALRSRTPARRTARRACAMRSSCSAPSASVTESTHSRTRQRSSCSPSGAFRSRSARPRIALPACARAEHPHPYLDFDRRGCHRDDRLRRSGDLRYGDRRRVRARRDAGGARSPDALRSQRDRSGVCLARGEARDARAASMPPLSELSRASREVKAPMPGHSHSHFAESFEMYMKAIYRLEREGPGVTTSALATELGVAPASVSGMLKKLVNDGFVEHEVRGDIKLTRKGLEVAVGVVRRNRLAERLLTDVLGMTWDEVYAEACILEHAITPRVEERLIAALGDPQTCPHGHPIPPADLTEPVRVGIPLAQVEAGNDALRFPAFPNRCPRFCAISAKSGFARACGSPSSRRRRSAARSRSKSATSATPSHSSSRGR